MDHVSTISLLPPLPDIANHILSAVLLLTGSVWLGGWFAVVVVARSTTATLQAIDRIAFFRHFGQLFGTCSTTALVLALASGLILIGTQPWTTISGIEIALGAVLVTALIAGISQAREQRRLRIQLVQANGDDTALSARITSGARAAGVLRAGLGAISVAIALLTTIQLR